MSKFFHSFLFLLIIKLSKCSEIISQKINRLISVYSTEILYGNPHKQWHQNINLISNITYSTDLIYHLESSTSITKKIDNQIFNIKNSAFNGTLIYDTLYLSGTTYELPDFPIFLASKQIDDNEYIQSDAHSLSLTFKYNDYSFSIVHVLYSKNIIPNLSFALSALDYENKGFLYFGGIDPYEINNKYLMKCKVNSKYKTWNLNFKQIVIGFKDKPEVTIASKVSYSYISTNHYSVNVPSDLMEMIKTELFLDLFKTNKCHYISNYNSFNYIECNCSEIEDFPNLTFYFDNQGIEFTQEMLFEKGMDYCYFIMINSNEHENKDRIILGNVFISRFDTVFDYSEETVTFYSQRAFKKIKNEMRQFGGNGFVKGVIMLNIWSLVFGVVLCVWIQIKF